MMEFLIASLNSRLLALTVGAAVFAATVVGYGVSWIAVGFGVFFGIGGLLLDYLTGFRYGNCGLTVLAACVGIGITAIFFSGDFVADGRFPWDLQYGAVLLISWTILMFVLPVRRDEP